MRVPRSVDDVAEYLLKAFDQMRYAFDAVSLRRRSLAGCTHVVTSRGGLYALGSEGVTKILSGQFFGLTVRGSAIYCFENLGPVKALTPYSGRILRLALDAELSITAATVVAKGLPNGCHQIDFIDDELYVCDTYNSRIVRFNPHFSDPTYYFPLGRVAFLDHDHGYAHINSIARGRGRIYLMAHNYTRITDRPSEMIAWDPASGEVMERLVLPGGDCHNIVFLEDGELLFCDSLHGAIGSRRGIVARIGEMYTRGLSVDAERIVVGASFFSNREQRVSVAGEICELDRSYREVRRLSVPHAPMEIRRIDGRDLSLANYSNGNGDMAG